MGGRQDTQQGRRVRPGLLRAVLLTAFGLLAGVLLLCARPGEPHAPAPTASQVREPAHAVCVSPYDLPGCSSLAHTIPGVLPVPPPAVAVAGGGPLPAAAAGGAGRMRAPEPLARAPGLHALQVLRT
ncbi:hypothetical protein [Streptomyces sp. ISL-94]|uniref:hypothetical protein n=1 Tax=Streptomyces sp. ISL-94 TaxID=2819190 RepID=UPI001BE97E78|nr:hypothetical protein [Streptomyces sp. ISL-94]MBT2477011.1 hypothetical protein [Streptomyces sp. ISL-94]